MENSLAFEANTALDVVRSDLNNHVSMVGRISMWLSMIHANELPLTEEPRDRLLTAWLEIFPPFKAALEELALREEHQGRLSNPATWRDIPSHFRAPLKADMLLAEKAMESSSEDQKKFLSLFSMVELPRVLRGVPATHLPNNVYRAGLELAASGVLLRQQTTDGKDRFSMTEALSRAWGKENGEIVILREYVDIDPLTVQGTGSSGGGSRKGAGWLAGD
jgi:hypothetical protein